jgi:hypothetical protein
MVVLQDFTGLSAGCDVPAEGHVEQCPRCGRSGIEQTSEDGGLLVHSQTSEILGDGMRIELQDSCAFSRA